MIGVVTGSKHVLWRLRMINKEKLKRFKKQLKKTDATWELLKERFDPNECFSDSLEELVSEECSFSVVIRNAFYWGDAPEGRDFWECVSVGDKLIANEGEVTDCIITSSDDKWTLEDSCPTLNKKQRKKLFKLLAEDLGYEIKG